MTIIVLSPAVAACGDDESRGLVGCWVTRIDQTIVGVIHVSHGGNGWVVRGLTGPTESDFRPPGSSVMSSAFAEWTPGHLRISGKAEGHGSWVYVLRLVEDGEALTVNSPPDQRVDRYERSEASPAHLQKLLRREESRWGNEDILVGLDIIASAVEDWKTQRGSYPGKGLVRPDSELAETTIPWPQNPTDGKPMEPGITPGSYQYSLANGAFLLRGYLVGGGSVELP